MDKKKRVGQYLKARIGGEVYNPYVPQSLPPKPRLELENIYHLLDQANIAIGQLDSLERFLPDYKLFLYMYIRKEAVMSSQIEGTQSSLSDLLMYENEGIPGVPEHDVIEVTNYVAAMEYGLKLLQEGFPLSLRLIRETHGVLLNRGRGNNKQAGEFRRSQNWIGGTRPGNAKFVPPPPEKIMELLGDLENFIHDDKIKLPTLIKAALVHVQFETIHPFLDGNGRLGRLLITFILCVDGLLTKPLLYLSLFFKEHREKYYEHLQSVRETGDWESWIQFFLQGVIETAQQAVSTAQKIVNLFADDRKKIENLGRPAVSALIVHHYMEKHSIIDIANIAKHCKMTIPTVSKSLKHMEELGIIKEITGKERHKIYVYKKYLDILNGSA